jgi:hypothetical protein
MSSVYDAPPKRKKSESTKGEEKKEKVSPSYCDGADDSVRRKMLMKV